MRNVTCEERMKQMIVVDKINDSKKIVRVVHAELVFLLKNFFDICSDDVEVNLDVDKNGKYLLSVNVVSRVIKGVRCFGN